jgi:hypothetical protein
MKMTPFQEAAFDLVTLAHEAIIESENARKAGESFIAAQIDESDGESSLLSYRWTCPVGGSDRKAKAVIVTLDIGRTKAVCSLDGETRFTVKGKPTQVSKRLKSKLADLLAGIS